MRKDPPDVVIPLPKKYIIDELMLPTGQRVTFSPALEILPGYMYTIKIDTDDEQAVFSTSVEVAP